MNAIIYIRVSTTEQAELGYSLKSQEEICLDYAKKYKYEVLRIFIERGESGKTANRTELKNMLGFIKVNKNKIDALIIYKMDRLSRNIYDSLTIRLMLEKLSIELKSVTEPFDDSPFGTFTATLFSSIAQLDNDIRTERSVLGMKQAVKEGRWLWNVPFGYTFKYENQKSYMIPTKDASIVKKIFDDFINGKRQYEIIDDLKNTGIKINKSHLNIMLRNYLYIGKLKTKFFNELINGLQEPIIDEITFYKAQNILNPKENNTYNIKYQNEFPLKRFLKCPNCNRNLAGSYSKGRTKVILIIIALIKDVILSQLKKRRQKNYLSSF
jgi:site-specific DNA recombinase